MRRTLLACVLLTACASQTTSDPKPRPEPRPAPEEDAAERRRTFLRHYAPVILQRASEGPTTRGRDWIADAFFDGDRNLANNARNWKAARPTARPTLYSALIETGTTMVLLYHVYHPAQRGSIHDWERIELRLDGVGQRPGQAERLSYVVLTEHKKHNAPTTYTSKDLNFLETPRSKRLLVWQADQFGRGKLRKGELHFVEESAQSLRAARGANAAARVDINGAGRTPFHYVYLPSFDGDAVREFSARPLTPETAKELSAGTDAPVTWAKVKALQYELQDLADLLPTHLDPRSWTDPLAIRLRSPVCDAEGRAVIPASPQAGSTRFFVRARDEVDAQEHRRGYPRKHWFWGTYHFDRKGSFTSLWLKGLTGPVPQHDYFLHDGTRDDPGGRWLLDAHDWWRPERGGFDGRWMALFP